MRIVGGELSGRKILAPQNGRARPTSDRAREAIFNMLFSLGFPAGFRVVDLFAGSGALSPFILVVVAGCGTGELAN